MESAQVEKRLCPRCGAPIGEQARFYERCGAAAGATPKQTCPECREPLSPTARFCPRCGSRAPRVRGAGVAAGWGHLQRRLAAIDWERAGRKVLPIAALLLAGLIGFIIGQQDARVTANRSVSATGGRTRRATKSAQEPFYNRR